MQSLISCLCVALLFGCGEPGSPSLEENLSPPAATDDGWPVSELELEGVQGQPVQNLVRELQLSPQRVDSFLIVRHGKLVLESYFGGWQRERLHELRSVSKSVNSLLVGIAIDQGALDGVGHLMVDLFPQYAALVSDGSKGAIGVEHLLTMSSGLRWDQTSFDHSDDRNNEGALERSDNWLEYVLSREMQYAPGEVFLYNSGCSALLAGIVKQATGEHSNIVAERSLFGPLGIERYYWQRQSDGLCNAWAGLSLRPRDMAKIGQLMLDHGRWQGQQVVSEEWVERSTTALQSSGANGYGYQWWTTDMAAGSTAAGSTAAGSTAAGSTAAGSTAAGSTAAGSTAGTGRVAEAKMLRVHSARGNGGQYIFIVPELDAVVVFTGSNYAPLDSGGPFGFMTNVVLPAMM